MTDNREAREVIARAIDPEAHERGCDAGHWSYAAADRILAALPADERLREAVTALEEIAMIYGSGGAGAIAAQSLTRIKDHPHAD